MPSNHLILCRPLLPPSIFPSIRVFPSESVLHIRWPKYWSFSFRISPSNEHPGLISFRMDWLVLLAVQGTPKSLFQHHSSKASILQCPAFFIVQLSHPYMTTGKTILTFWGSLYPGQDKFSKSRLLTSPMFLRSRNCCQRFSRVFDIIGYFIYLIGYFNICIPWLSLRCRKKKKKKPEYAINSFFVSWGIKITVMHRSEILKAQEKKKEHSNAFSVKGKNADFLFMDENVEWWPVFIITDEHWKCWGPWASQGQDCVWCNFILFPFLILSKLYWFS